MSKYKLAVFDLDGTVLDTLPDLAAAVNHALRAFGLPERSIDTIRRFIGNGVRKLIERSVYVSQKEMDEAVLEGSTAFLRVVDNYSVTEPEKVAAIHAEFVSYYLSHSTVYTVPFEGITEVFDNLKTRGIRIAMVTNKRDDVAQQIIEKFFPDVFECVIGDREGHPRKPAPDSVLEILDRLKVAASDAVYIGDSNVDVDTATNAGMDCIAVSWGYRDLDFLLGTGATRFATAVSDLSIMI